METLNNCHNSFLFNKWVNIDFGIFSKMGDAFSFGKKLLVLHQNQSMEWIQPQQHQIY